MAGLEDRLICDLSWSVLVCLLGFRPCECYYSFRDNVKILKLQKNFKSLTMMLSRLQFRIVVL